MIMKIVSVVNLVNNLMVNNGIYKNNSKNFYKVDGDLSISKMIFLNKENFQENPTCDLKLNQYYAEPGSIPKPVER